MAPVFVPSLSLQRRLNPRVLSANQEHQAPRTMPCLGSPSVRGHRLLYPPFPLTEKLLWQPAAAGLILAYTVTTENAPRLSGLIRTDSV